MQLVREAIRQRSDFVGAHRVLAAAAGMSGHTEVATAALQELRRVQPSISPAWIANEMPIMQAANWSTIWKPSAGQAWTRIGPDANQARCPTW
jgi:hypothetical protein